ncbi:MAG: GatB/YqeY domain-containing protein [Propionibacteriaceae bacterium]|jgi:uncharacterized protein YqeY|nr:GatB/YqeY domain-containing protein [Propionibacteriaceae bacterium]
MAALKATLRADLTDAMKAKEAFRTQTLRMALAAIANEEVAGKAARELTEAQERQVVTREVRKRRDSAEVYGAAGRAELAAKETAEADLLAGYLPAALTDAELDAVVAEEVANAPGATLKQMGVVIKAVNARVQGRADGSAVAAKVKAALSAA